jgi:hypothetical protein
MSRFFACLALLLVCSVSIAQKTFFVYIQSESNQPFFVKMGDKTFGSAAGGYLILSELKDSTYQFKVGFPQNKWPDQQFVVAIKSKDKGFLLKNFGEKGWGLFDLQTLAVQMAAQDNAGMKQRELRELSAFTEVLSKAANDPSLRYKPEFAVARTETPVANAITALQPKQNDTVAATAASEASSPTQTEVAQTPVANANTEQVKDPVALNDSSQTLAKVKAPVISATQQTEKAGSAPTKDNGSTESQPAVSPPRPNTATAPLKNAPVYVRSTVIKKSESSTTDGFGLTFVDRDPSGGQDTIQILIPNPPVVLGPKATENPKFLEITDEERDGRPLGSKPLAKNACSTTGTESDFLKLRKKMAGQKTEDAMIEEAKKAFRVKCYSTEHIRNLGNLFLKEAAKFQFYEAVYPYSADRDNFTALQAEFKDNYFIHRFRNLVKPGNL